MESVRRFKTSDQNPLGMVVDSILTEAQFQSANGTGWVLMDGRSIVGSQLAALTGLTTLPDARGLVRRGKNNGRADGKQNPDGDLALGTYQADTFGSHNHGGTIRGDNAGDMSAGSRFVCIAAPAGGDNITVNSRDSDVISSQGGNETRMRCLTMNTFIKINP